VRGIVNDTADRVCELEGCELHIAEDMLCRSYIAVSASVMDNSSWFLQGEAESGAEIWLLKVCGDFLKEPGQKRRIATGPRLRSCGRQLSFYTAMYFPRYPDVLTQMFNERLRSLNGESIKHINLDGILKLAAADLPNVQDEIRRHARRLGVTCPGNIVPLTHMARRRAVTPPNRLRLT
jgi:hypothetical protein